MRSSRAFAAWWAAALLACTLHASAAERRLTFDRVVVRYTAADAGGPESPRFLFAREVAFLVRLEALREEGRLQGDWLDRHLHSTVERHIAEQLLAARQVRSEEPANLPQQVVGLRLDLERVVGAERLREAMAAEGLSDAELGAILADRVRAMAYVDREVSPLFRPSEDELHLAFRSSAHPYRERKYEQARDLFLSWFVQARYRAVATDYWQSAKSRMHVVYL